MPVFEFHLTKISKLGDYDPMYFQRYWGYAEGDDTPISFNSPNQEIIEDMDITAEEKTMKKSKSGTTYWQLRKVKVVGASASNPKPATKPATEPRSVSRSDSEVMETLRRIEEKVDKLVGEPDDMDNHYDTERDPGEPMSDGFLQDDADEDPPERED